MKLYSGPVSLFTAKVRIALAEKGIAYEHESVPFSKHAGYSPKHPEVLRIHPKAQVPVLIDDDLELYDSTLILEYLEDRNPQPPLYPTNLRERALCRQAEAAADEIFFPNVLVQIQEVFYKPAGIGRDEARVAAAQQAIHQQYRDLDERLRGRSYFFDHFTVADITYCLNLVFASNFGLGPQDCDNLQAWFAGIAARPAVAADLTAMTDWMATH